MFTFLLSNDCNKILLVFLYTHIIVSNVQINVINKCNLLASFFLTIFQLEPV